MLESFGLEMFYQVEFEVYSIKVVHERVDTYNLEVEPYHNYIVGEYKE